MSDSSKKALISPSTLHPLQLLASIATILTFLFLVGSGIYSIWFGNSASSIIAKYDWMDLPTQFHVDDDHRFAEQIDAIGQTLKVEELKHLVQQLQMGFGASIIKMTIANEGTIISKPLHATLDNFLLGITIHKRGSAETNSVVSKSNVEFGILEPGDILTLYAVVSENEYRRDAPRLLHGDVIIPVHFEKFVGTEDPLGFIPWAIAHPGITLFLTIELELLLALLMLLALPFAVKYLWRTLKR